MNGNAIFWSKPAWFRRAASARAHPNLTQQPDAKSWRNRIKALSGDSQSLFHIRRWSSPRICKRGFAAKVSLLSVMVALAGSFAYSVQANTMDQPLVLFPSGLSSHMSGDRLNGVDETFAGVLSSKCPLSQSASYGVEPANTLRLWRQSAERSARKGGGSSASSKQVVQKTATGAGKKAKKSRQAPTGPVNVNKASVAELARALKGVGPRRAAKIVAYRKEVGPFRDFDDLKDVAGIGQHFIDQNKSAIVFK